MKRSGRHEESYLPKSKKAAGQQIKAETKSAFIMYKISPDGRKTEIDELPVYPEEALQGTGQSSSSQMQTGRYNPMQAENNDAKYSERRIDEMIKDRIQQAINSRNEIGLHKSQSIVSKPKKRKSLTLNDEEIKDILRSQGYTWKTNRSDVYLHGMRGNGNITQLIAAYRAHK